VKITETITVQADAGTVWRLFQDVPQLAHCLPGADVTEDKGGGVYAGKITSKLGPISVTFEGEATVTSDVTAMTGEVVGNGIDRSGGSAGQVKMRYSIDPHDDGSTKIDVHADVVLSGAAAQFGRTGLIKEMSRRLIDEFVECVEAKLDATTATEAETVHAGDVKGLSLFLSSLWGSFSAWLKRLTGRG